MTIYTYPLFYFGNYNLDPNEATWYADNAALVEGQSAGNNLKLVTVTTNDGDNRLLQDTTYFNTGAVESQGNTDTLTYNLGAGNVTAVVDEVSLVNVTLTLADNTTIVKTMLLTNLVNGETFIGPLSADETFFNGITVRDITLNSFDDKSTNSPSLNNSLGDTLPNPQITTQIVVCFTSEMEIETRNGAIRAGDLQIGDCVRTYDRGFQPVRFVYKWRSPSIGKNRPVIFDVGTIGNHKPVHVSQEHRILLETVREDLLPKSLAGQSDALIKASLLVNGVDVRIDTTSSSVEYCHIMFDEHELIYCNGSISESWQPKYNNLGRDAALKAELKRLFPNFLNLASENRQLVRPEFFIVRNEDARQFAKTRRATKLSRLPRT